MARPSLTIWFNSVEIYPREETETICKPIIHKSLELKFIPVRGRKPSVVFTDWEKMQLKFIPVRGRKRIHSLTRSDVDIVEIYPREGTETHPCLPIRSC